MTEQSSKAKHYTFGVEIECTLPREVIRQEDIYIGEYHRGSELPHPLFPSGWTCQEDGSVSAPAHRYALEIVSPPISGESGLAQVQEVLATIRALDGSVNRSCGFHVHVGVGTLVDTELVHGGIETERLGRATEIVGRVLALAYRHEAGLYGITGTVRRVTGEYCQRSKTSVNRRVITAINRAPFDRKHSTGRNIRSRGRYALLNLENFFFPREHMSGRTVEFRGYSGTLNYSRAAAWIQLSLAICERATEIKRLRLDSKVADRAVLKGPEAAVKVLLDAVGWTAGKMGWHGKGRTEILGWLESPGKLESRVDTLKDLAVKFRETAVAIYGEDVNWQGIFPEPRREGRTERPSLGGDCQCTDCRISRADRREVGYEPR